MQEASSSCQALRPELTSRAAALEALKPLGTLGDGVYGGDAIYLWARLPKGKLIREVFPSDSLTELVSKDRKLLV